MKFIKCLLTTLSLLFLSEIARSYAYEQETVSWKYSEFSSVRSWREIKNEVDRVLPEFVKQSLKQQKVTFIPLLSVSKAEAGVRVVPTSPIYLRRKLNQGQSMLGSPMRSSFFRKVFILISEEALSLRELQDLSSEGKKAVVNQVLRGILEEYYHSLSSQEQAKVSLDMKSLNLFLKYMNSNQFSSLNLEDEYSVKSRSFQFALNAEKFLTDPDFSCRRPYVDTLMRRIFQKISSFEWKAVHPVCKNLNTVVYTHEGYPQEIHLDRVYEIHYLLASKGEGIGAFGHSMVRVVMCRPGQEKSEACLEQISEDVVFNFRAFVNGIVLEPFVGLGWRFFSDRNYPSQLMVYNMPELKSEYNLMEGRSLESYPLKMTKEQMMDFLKASLEVYWAYQGDYAFLSRNCATESANLINFVFPHKKFSKGQDMNISSHMAPHLAHHRNRDEVFSKVSPFGVLENMKQVHIINEDVDLKSEGTYYFPAYNKSLHQCLKKVYNSKALKEVLDKTAFVQDSYESLMENFKSLSSSKRRLFVDKILNFESFSYEQKDEKLSCLRVLELKLKQTWELEYIRRQDHLILALSKGEVDDLGSELSVKVKNNDNREKIALKDWVSSYTKNKKAIYTPSHFIRKDLGYKPYGIPFEHEIDVKSFNKLGENVSDLLWEIDSFYKYAYDSTESENQDPGLSSFIEKKGLPLEFLASMKTFTRILNTLENINYIREKKLEVELKKCELLKSETQNSGMLDPKTEFQIKKCETL